MRRLGESHLRAGRYPMGAQQFLAASTVSGAEPGDRAWTEVSKGLWSSRPDWTESRARALAPAPAPPVRRAEAPASTPAELATAAERRPACAAV